MSVIPTDEWLNELIASQKLNHKNLEGLQRSILCSRLVEIFIGGSLDEIQFELLQQGLFQSHEKIDINKLKRQNIWEVVQKEFNYLKEKWSGPNIPIYIFPITQEQTITKKNGVAYPNALFLYIGELEKQELKALFAHEYNHVCRLQYVNKTLDEVTLLDSLILEGLAECAVEEIYGDRWLAPWLRYYSLDKMLEIWKGHFLPQINIQGLNNHVEFLYGGKLPQWIGYCIGYEIVRTYIKNHSSNKLHEKSSDEILAGSDFSL
ncbi:hypothetical protein ABE61_16180 [Lysinibacillus sphaericus]|uniref:DUF2268 domain-containing protein n=1 Tax=Lysinibacillus sphaericus TaxID=1421 RepID=UPI0018CE3F21|nr:DUF2268 domain-containing putative Zn-dependent protease [Lysinibacillus sphaericus]MBG9455559.1 hypothetical protein [Lysinibacillus sphaericus]MBG9477976.1 hypothetical protein [Lysinibacillus sphaericus]MBG9594116.1 hypothetical protein [Lysinibacillus sphaericus]